MGHPNATKSDFFQNILRSNKVLFVNVGLSQSICTGKFFFIGQIYFHWLNLFCEIYDVRPSATKSDFFQKIPRSKKVLFVNVGRVQIQSSG